MGAAGAAIPPRFERQLRGAARRRRGEEISWVAVARVIGVSEIRDYGHSSAQVCRRLRAMLRDLEDGVLPANRAAVRRQLALLDTSVTHSFADGRDRAFALGADRQGIGGAAHLTRRG